MSILKLELTKAYLIDNFNKGFIEPSIALFAAPILFAKKQDGSFRFYIDFRALNNLTRKDRYPFLLIDKTFARLLRAKIFTKLDIRQAFHKIQIDSASKELTTFKTRYDDILIYSSDLLEHAYYVR
ncbi:polymerase [Drepanopeziza brunnea f. sp. 'multigermtubi' MB_m1]|uniref:Polymerase n=1 Tax=Marssonina brunnea f. sp. multigermtubi (strain MB_m1) TaxID=1072389 RepID=K1WT97_MARBU|nr:polymerase [Drepanopeziza brunnea f. sp. 'multigermtubi' MB_m1]EKD16286.1 polymerase [Drepanopeziza brunnea f. sp. 'multigermtubi' MB_m1]